MDLYGPLLGPKNYIQMEENWLSAYNILKVLKARIQFVLSETYLQEPHCCSRVFHGRELLMYPSADTCLDFWNEKSGKKN